ncbi:MAG TPA: RodZ domain-containing protein [Burkholderiales bacterium]|nr:RodZ domain-containing protein [Burkholderiales bacterium]
MTDMADNPEMRVRERGPGAVLAAARTAQNLSIADVARQLKLSASQVAALEAGEYERLPGPVFVRGFVRNYARLLKVDPDRLLEMVSGIPGADVANEMPTTRGTPFPTHKEHRWPRLLMLSALLAVVALGAYEFYWYDRSSTDDAPVSAVPPIAIPEPAVPSAPAPVSSAPAAAPSAPPGAPAEPAVAPVEVTTPSANEGTPTPAISGEGALRFVFSRDSWVQVRDGTGKVIMTRLNAAGTEQTLSGKPPFSLVIGNARGVRLSYNGESVDLGPHTVRDDVARLRLE